MTVSAIMEMFGGLSAFARLAGVPVSTAHSWKSTNYIPEWRQPKVLDLALAHNKSLSTTDFPERVAA